MVSGGRSNVSVLRALGRATVATALMCTAFFATALSAQAPAVVRPAAASTPDATPPDQRDLDVVKAENVALRELLRKVEEQQKFLLEQVDRLQRRLDAGGVADLSVVGRPSPPPVAADVPT